MFVIERSNHYWGGHQWSDDITLQMVWNFSEKTCYRNTYLNQRGTGKYNTIPQLFPLKVGIFIPLEVLAWVMTACWALRSRLIYFWRNMNMFSIFYFSKSTSVNTQHSSLWGTLTMMLFTKYLIKWKRIGKISWKFRHCFNLSFFIELDIKR